jgi:hypothetical protein
MLKRRLSYALFAIVLSAMAIGLLEHAGVIAPEREEQLGQAVGGLVFAGLLLWWAFDATKKRP